MIDKNQINQIKHFLTAYQQETAEAGIEAWRTGEMPDYQGIEGMETDTPLAQNYNELDEDAKEYVVEESRRLPALPFCLCGKQLNLAGVCGGCPQGQEGYRSKFMCSSCGYEEYFKESVQEKLIEIRGVI